jgi:DNA-binding beta-propeller fold protein YncE
MNSLLSALTRYVRRPRRGTGRARPAPRKARRPRLCLELLEDRTVPSATISVAGSTLNEIGAPDTFVTAGSGGLSSPYGITLGPDGNVYVASNGGEVLRYNGTTGAFLSTFVSQGSGGLAFSTYAGLAFGPDGNLYVASGSTNQVLEYNGTTGAFIQAFVTAGSGGLSDPSGVTFGPDGNLYVSSRNSNAVLRYQGPSGSTPGAPLPAAGQTGATFALPNAGLQPLNLLFGPDGNLYVDGAQNFGVQRFSGTTGAFLNMFVPEQDPAHGDLADGRGMAFDQQGNFYVSDSGDSVLRYDAQGNFLGDLLVGAANPSLSKPLGMTFDAQGNLLITCRDSNTAVRYDRGVNVTLSAASATPVTVSYTTADGTALAGTNYDAQSGTVTFAPGQTSREVLLATQEDLQATGNVAFSVQLSNPTGGATIGTGTATVTVVVDDTTRQFSVADTSAVEGDPTAHYRGAFVQGIPGNSFNPVTFGPDGNLYISAGTGPGTNAIDEYNGTTGAFIGQFVAPGVMFSPRAMVFNGGYLYVASSLNNEVLQFNASTGALVSVFVPAGSGGLSSPDGMTFGPDGNLYVTSANNSVLRYNGTTGAFLGAFVASGSGGLSGPAGIAFDPSGAYLYVASAGSNQVLKYNGQTGAFVGVAASAGLSSPQDVKFGSDGLLYVLNYGNNRILRYTEGGAYVDDYVPAGSGGMADPYFMAFGPTGDLYVTTTGNDQVLQFGTESEALFTVTNTTPSTLPLTVNYATADGTAHAGTNYTATSGTLTFAPGWTTATVRVPLLDSGSQTTPLTFTLNLSSPVGGSLSRSQATGTVQPSDQAAKFYVVNDSTSTLGGANTDYKYQASGTAQGPYGLNLADLSPRGVASNAAGTTQWVVDASGTVYVYSPRGTLLGSWTPTGLSPSPNLTGIATNGTDIWLVDGASDKVYKYAGAASRRSGSQAAASSFSLTGGHNGNTNPQDIVTDGTSFWVVDGTQLKVFKYTLAGKSLGSWSIDPADTQPTGITINPNNVSDVWIVDSGTDKVYQYIGAASRTSGSQNAGATFALAAGNTNPQGIADPPPGLGLVTAAAAPALSPPPVLPMGASLPRPATDLPAGGALTPRVEGPALAATLMTGLVASGTSPTVLPPAGPAPAAAAPAPGSGPVLVAGTGLPRPGEPAGARPGADPAGEGWDGITAADHGPVPAAVPTADGGISRSAEEGDRDTVPAAAPEDGAADAWFAALEDTGAQEAWGLLAAADRIAQAEASDPEELRAALVAVFEEP